MKIEINRALADDVLMLMMFYAAGCHAKKLKSERPFDAQRWHDKWQAATIALLAFEDAIAIAELHPEREEGTPL